MTQLVHDSQGPLNGGVSNRGVSRSGRVLPFCPFWDFPDFSGIFPICSGMVRGFSRFVPFLFLSLLRAPMRNSPERVRDTIWTFPEKSGGNSQEVCFGPSRQDPGRTLGTRMGPGWAGVAPTSGPGWVRNAVKQSTWRIWTGPLRTRDGIWTVSKNAHAEGGATKGGVSKCENTQTNADKRRGKRMQRRKRKQTRANASKRKQTLTPPPLYCGFLHPTLQST